MGVETKTISGHRCIIIYNDAEKEYTFTNGINVVVSNKDKAIAERSFSEALLLSKIISNTDTKIKKLYQPPFRVGRHLGCVILDSNGKIVAKFGDIDNPLAYDVCDYINKKYIHLT